MIAAATVAIAVLVAVLAVLAVLIVAVRATRTIRQRRHRVLVEAPRRALLAFVAEGGEEGGDELVDLPAKPWRAAEPGAVAMLGKVRGEAHRALVLVFERRGVAARAERDLRSRVPVRRARAAEILGNLGRTDAVPALCRLLDDRHSEVRVVAVRALGRIGDPAAAWRLLASLARAEPAPALLVTQALAQLGRGAEGALQAALGHAQPGVRVAALDALGLLGATGTVGRVTEVLRADPQLDVRVAAVGTLGKLSTRTAVPPLIDALGAGSPAALRAAAARALGDLTAAAAVAPLAELLADPDYRVAHQAAHALRRLGAAGLARLRQAATDGPAAGRPHAQEALAMSAVEISRPDPAPAQSLAGTR